MTNIVPEPVPNLPIEPGQSVSIFSVPYIFDRADPDGSLTIRAFQGSGDPDFMVVGENGHPRKPNWTDIRKLHADGDLELHASPLKSEVRNRARSLNLDTAIIDQRDPNARFKHELLRRYRENPCKKSNRALKGLIEKTLQDPDVAKYSDGWTPSPRTLRHWLQKLEEASEILLVDGMSMTGIYPRKLTVSHPIEIVLYYLLRATAMQKITNAYELYRTELSNINNGIAIHRPLLVGQQGDFHLSDQPAFYPIPETPYEPISEISFRRWVKRLESRQAFRARTSARKETSEFGGGGEAKVQLKVGDEFIYDDTPLPKEVFAVTLKGSVSIGALTLGLMIDSVSTVIVGWHLTIGAPNSSTFCRTLLSANAAKNIPEHFLRIDPGLGWIRGKSPRIRLDNPQHHHGYCVEDVCREAGITLIYSGADQPRDKAHVECILGILQHLLLGEFPDRILDPTSERKLGVRDVKVECTYDQIVELLPSAISLFNLMKSKAHDMRSRALVWKNQLGSRKLPVIHDTARLEKEIGVVRTDVSITNQGLNTYGRRYTPGAQEMSRILEDFKRGVASQIGGTTPKRSSKRNQNTFKVRIKVNPDDLSFILVWNPYRLSGPDWETFECTDPAMKGVPLWLHEQVLEQAAIESNDYISDEEQAIMRAHVLQDLRALDPKADERERKLLGKALQSPGTRHFVSQLTQVVGEVTPENFQPFQTTKTATGRKVTTNVPKSRRPRNLDAGKGRKAVQSAPAPEMAAKAGKAPRKSARANLTWGE